MVNVASTLPLAEPRALDVATLDRPLVVPHHQVLLLLPIVGGLRQVLNDVDGREYELAAQVRWTGDRTRQRRSQRLGLKARWRGRVIHDGRYVEF